ncbi:MAG: UTP--glucose-1-phosphate uridylyltransferase [Chlamydiae bacterium]|nr:UTP--glucose-1-phosphate uridylyltransferase [Chlamydiota bacterium]
MIKKFIRRFLPNPFDRMLDRLARKKKGERARILLGWNRGLGDIALGLYAMVQRIREKVPGVEVIFLIRENLQSGFSMLSGVETIVAPFWKRGESYSIRETLKKLGIDAELFDLIIEKPSPTDWVRWQLGTLTPKLHWKSEYDELANKFQLPDGCLHIGAQASAETSYGQWRNWPEERWREFLSLLQPNEKVILFGFGSDPKLESEQVIDLRGKTSLFEMISLIKNRCPVLIVPDSGILSMIYYLDAVFPIHVVSLWAETNQGILKQNVKSPNPLLVHSALVGEIRDLSNVSARRVYEEIFPQKKTFEPLTKVVFSKDVSVKNEKDVGCVILAGGQGTRLGFAAPKGLFPIGGKTLFERIVRKVPDKVPIAIMTSQDNHEETIRYFEEHRHFGKKLLFFQQSSLPLLDEQKRPFGLEGADGNGSFYRRFVETGVADAFSKLGIKTVTITPVDNALADPLDPKWLSFHRKTSSEVTIRCIERNGPDELMGSLVQRGDEIQVLEYSEIAPDKLREQTREGKLRYLYAYTGLVCLEMSFIRRVSSLDLPLHWVQKDIQHKGREMCIWKGEKFLFDPFPRAKSIGVLCSPREECYAPLKTKDGPRGIEAVEKALCQ